MNLNRIPVIALEYVNSDISAKQAINQEMLINYETGDIYVKDKNGNIISCTSKYADVASRSITLSDGSVRTLQEVIDDVLNNTIRTSSTTETNLNDLEPKIIKVGDIEFVPKTTISAVYDENGQTLVDILYEINSKLANQIMVSSTQETITATEENQRTFTLGLPGSSDYNFLNIHTTLVFNGITFYDNRHYDIVGNILKIHDDIDGIILGRDITVIYLFSYYQKDISNYLTEGVDGVYIRDNTIPINKLKSYSDRTDLNESFSLATSAAVYDTMQKAKEAYDLAGSTPVHSHDYTTVRSVNASTIQSVNGSKIPMECIPDAAQKKLHTVTDMAAMYKLTISTVSIYDYVRVLDAGNGESKMFLVIDITRLSSADGYQEFSGGDSVDWTHVFNTPTTLLGYGISDAVNTSMVSETSAAGKLVKVNAANKLPVNISGDADTLDGIHAAGFATATHTHPIATTVVDGLMSKTDKSKLDGITTVTTSADGLMSKSDKSKLDGISANANNYTHPTTHDASIISESSTKRFVTDTEKSTWNGKLDATAMLDTYSMSTTSDTLKVSKKINAAGGIKMDNGTTLVHNSTTLIDGNGVVYNARYNDLAEAFEAEDISILEPGDVISCTEDGKYIKSRYYEDNTVVGVYSDTYGQLLGASGDDNLIEKGLIPIGLAGRVYVKVYGAAKVGDLLVASGVPGVACVSSDPSRGTVIGKVLENKNTAEISRIRMLIMNS